MLKIDYDYTKREKSQVSEDRSDSRAHKLLAVWLLICAVALVVGLATVHDRTQEQIEHVSSTYQEVNK